MKLTKCSGLFVALGITLLCAQRLVAEEKPPKKYDGKAHYQKATQMVPMRDGVKLFTAVYTPRNTTEKLPFLLFRTPYGIGSYGPNDYSTRLGPSPHSFEFEEEGFIFVFQGVRGKFKSE